MRKFQFKYQAVLHERKMKEGHALELLADAQHALQKELELKNGLIKELQYSLERKEQLGVHAVKISEFQSEQAFIIGTKQRMIQADQRVFRAQKSVDKALRNYAQCKRKSQIMEELREKYYIEYKKDLKKNDQKQIDDLVVMRLHLKEELI